MHLHGVTAPDAADYLQRARTGPPPSDWPSLLGHLRKHPDSVLARGLSTPLTLLCDTYQAGDDISELLDTTRYGTGEHLERHLVARVLPAAHASRPGRPPPLRYSETQAVQALTFLARARNQDHTRDLGGWLADRLIGLGSGLVVGS